MRARNDLTIYDKVADRWWSGDTRWIRTLQNMVPARMRHFETVVPSFRGKDVLDLGCAGGFLAEAIAARGARVTGIDPAAEAVAAAKAHADEMGIAIRYDVGVGEALPYPDSAFDMVACVDVLEHVADLDKVLDEIARVLRPGGVFLFDTINKTWLARLVVVTVAEDILGLLPKGTHDPALFIPPARLAEGLRARGFEVGKFRGLGPVGINRRGDFRFGLLPFTRVIYIGHAALPAK
ncbi:MAG: bifunctional 2-polyprenyl-6-hydroxyphenol methylase/3-demethylubiquinol 3-O-methyltransferase UbiG [Pseudomonadota bacterium]